MADTWPLSDQAEQSRLERFFAERSIDYSNPTFCDTAAFITEEQRDPRFLETYARYVEVRAYAADYLADARRKISVVAEVVQKAVAEDGRMGACVDASGMVGRMLDRLKIWNYVAKSSLTIQFPPARRLSPRYFWAIDEGEFTAPHAIVVAPPFAVVDVTVKLQPYERRESASLPHLVLADKIESATWVPVDLANSEILMSLKEHGVDFMSFMRSARPNVLEVMEHLKPRQVFYKGTSLKYVLVAVGGSLEQLEGITGYQPNGVSALQLFEQKVLPRLAAI